MNEQIDDPENIRKQILDEIKTEYEQKLAYFAGQYANHIRDAGTEYLLATQHIKSLRPASLLRMGASRARPYALLTVKPQDDTQSDLG